MYKPTGGTVNQISYSSALTLSCCSDPDTRALHISVITSTAEKKEKKGKNCCWYSCVFNGIPSVWCLYLGVNIGNGNRMWLLLLCFGDRLTQFSSCRVRVRSVLLESRHANRSAAERKRSTLRPERSRRRAHARTHSCSYVHSPKNKILIQEILPD